MIYRLLHALMQQARWTITPISGGWLMERGAAEAQWSMVRGRLTGGGARVAAGQNRRGHTVAVSLQSLGMSVSPGFAVDMDVFGS